MDQNAQSDIDIVYFDPSDISETTEKNMSGNYVNG
nr:hypothetical protein [Exiguobacterium sp. UBA6282]